MFKSNINFLNLVEDFMQELEQIGRRIQRFLNENYQNPLLWIGICIFLFGLVAWAINYLNKN